MRIIIETRQLYALNAAVRTDALSCCCCCRLLQFKNSFRSKLDKNRFSQSLLNKSFLAQIYSMLARASMVGWHKLNEPIRELETAKLFFWHWIGFFHKKISVSHDQILATSFHKYWGKLCATWSFLLLLKMGHTRPLFLYFRLFNTVDSKYSV